MSYSEDAGIISTHLLLSTIVCVSAYTRVKERAVMTMEAKAQLGIEKAFMRTRIRGQERSPRTMALYLFMVACIQCTPMMRRRWFP